MSYNEQNFEIDAAYALSLPFENAENFICEMARFHGDEYRERLLQAIFKEHSIA